MAAVNENDSSGVVVTETLTLGSTVAADDEVGRHAKPVLATREVLKQDIRQRQDADDDVRKAHGAVTAAEYRTDAHLVAFAAKVAGRYAQPGAPGEQSAEFLRLFDGKTAASLLPGARDERTAELGQLRKRLEDRQTHADVKKDAADLLKVIARELDAVAAHEAAAEAFEKAAGKEVASKVATVVAARACRNLVTADCAKTPARARKLLGQATPGGRKSARSKADEARRLLAEAERLANVAREAAAAAEAAMLAAKKAQEEAEAEAVAETRGKLRKKGGEGTEAA